MSIFHCLVIDSTTSKEVTTENPNLYCVLDNPETSFNTSTNFCDEQTDSFVLTNEN